MADLYPNEGSGIEDGRTNKIPQGLNIFKFARHANLKVHNGGLKMGVRKKIFRLKHLQPRPTFKLFYQTCPL